MPKKPLKELSDETGPSLPVAPSQVPATLPPKDAKPLVSINPNDMESLFRLAKGLARSTLLPKHITDGGRASVPTIEANVFWMLQCGAEVGVGATQALNQIAVINGRPCMWGDLVIGLVRRSGLAAYIDETSEGEGDDLIATCSSRRVDTGEVITRKYSWAEAKTAGLTNRGPYKTNGPRMIQLRARAFCLRDGYADVLAGMRVAEEERDIEILPPIAQPPRPTRGKVIEVTDVDSDDAETKVDEVTTPEEDAKAVAGGLIADLDGVVNVEDLDELYDTRKPEIEDLPDDLKAIVEGKYEAVRDSFNLLRGG